MLILSGAGLSVASGIPTFRGSEGFWTGYRFAGENGNEEDEIKSTSTAFSEAEKPEDPSEVCTMRYFNQYPELNWKWHYNFLDLMEEGKINKGHKLIDQLMKKKNGKFLHVTQNIDDYCSQLAHSNSFKTPKPRTESDF